MTCIVKCISYWACSSYGSGERHGWYRWATNQAGPIKNSFISSPTKLFCAREFQYTSFNKTHKTSFCVFCPWYFSVILLLSVWQSTDLLVGEKDFVNPSVNSIFFYSVFTFSEVPELQQIFFYDLQRYLIGMSSWQANQRHQEHKIITFPLATEWNGSCGVRMSVFPWRPYEFFCSCGDMKLIQVLWFPNGPEWEKERESRWDDK